MTTLFFILLSLFLGATLSIYLPMNSAVAKHLESTLAANITFFLVALIASIIIFIIWGRHETIHNLGKVPAWLYAAGIFSAIMVLGTTYLIPLLGMRKFFILTVSGQILTAIVLSHFGFLGTPEDTITIRKVFGALLVIAGAIFSTV